MKKGKDDVVEIIDYEIRCCAKNPKEYSDINKSYQEGFMDGLVQAKYLIMELWDIESLPPI